MCPQGHRGDADRGETSRPVRPQHRPRRQVHKRAVAVAGTHTARIEIADQEPTQVPAPVRDQLPDANGGGRRVGDGGGGRWKRRRRRQVRRTGRHVRRRAGRQHERHAGVHGREVDQRQDPLRVQTSGGQPDDELWHVRRGGGRPGRRLRQRSLPEGLQLLLGRTHQTRKFPPDPQDFILI